MNVFHHWLPPEVIDSTGALLLDVAIKATVVLLVAGGLAALLRRTSAAVRHRIWCLACGGLLILPILTLFLPSLRIPILPERTNAETAKGRLPGEPTSDDSPTAVPASASQSARAWTGSELPRAAHRRARPGGTNVSVTPSPQIAEPTEGAPTSPPSETMPWGGMIAIVWLIGAVLAAMPLFYGFWANRRLARASRPVENRGDLELLEAVRDRLRLRRPLRLLETGRVIIPMTWGLVRPIVLFPSSWRDWSESRRRLVLLHELAHVQRYDVAFQVLARLACAVYWFHPLAWYALRRVRIERELACDDCVLLTGERPSEYAGQLLELARAYRPGRAATPRAALQPSSLEQRVRALLDQARSRVPLGRTTGRMLLLSSLCLIIGVAVVKPGRATDGPEAVAADDGDNKTDTRPKRERGADEPDATKAVTLSGQVLAPDGKPHPQATVWVELPFSTEWTRIATANEKGRFSASINGAALKAALAKHPHGKVRVAATAEGLGLAWVDVEPAALDDVTLQLCEDRPVEGRIVTLEGKPVPGVTVHVGAMPNKHLKDIEAFARSAPGSSGVHTNTPWLWLPGGGPGSEPVVTDKQGRFRIKGVGAERLVYLEAAGERIADTRLAIATFPAPESAPSNGAIVIKKGLAASYYYANFTHVAVPGRTVHGVVTDAKTGEPVADVRITALEAWHSREHPAMTGADGRYKITGVPRQEKYHLLFEPQSSLHFNKELRLPDPGGLDSLAVDVSLLTGIILRGRLTDAKTGEPLAGTVVYNPLFPNENVEKLGKNYAIAKPAAEVHVSDDGRYEISVLPGPGAIAAEVPGNEYVSATVEVDRLREFLPVPDLRKVANIDGQANWLPTALDNQSRGIMPLYHKQSAAVINPADDVKELTVDLAARRGLSRHGTLKDDEGQPLAGVEVLGLGVNAVSITREPLETAQFTVKGLLPGRTRMLLFVHEQRGLGAKVLVTGNQTTPLTVGLKPTGTITGRFVDKAGDPLPGVRVHLNPRFNSGGSISTRLGSWWAETDKEGRFRINGLIPDVAYGIHAQPIQESGVAPYVPADIRLEPGQTVDLGTFTRKDEHRYRRVSETSGNAETRPDPTTRQKPTAPPPSPDAAETGS